MKQAQLLNIGHYPASIKAAFARQGLTYKEIAKASGCHIKDISVALRQPCPTGERAIAAALGTTPNIIWPDRYDHQGESVHVRNNKSNANSNKSQSQKGAAA